MIHTKSGFLFLLFVALSINLFAQDDILTKVQEKEPGQGDILIFQDMRINELLYNHQEQSKRKEGVPGYRIHIYSNLGSSARDESQEFRTRFYELFPEIPIYREYDSPYFKVYVGDYRTKIDALEDFKNIKKYFRSAFIVPDKINYPELEN